MINFFFFLREICRCVVENVREGAAEIAKGASQHKFKVTPLQIMESMRILKAGVMFLDS